MELESQYGGSEEEEALQTALERQHKIDQQRLKLLTDILNDSDNTLDQTDDQETRSTLNDWINVTEFVDQILDDEAIWQVRKAQMVLRNVKEIEEL